MGFSDDVKNKIIAQITKKTKVSKCPLCGHNKLVLIDGYTHRSISDTSREVRLGGITVPTISFFCENCGYMLDFAERILTKDEEEVSKKDGRT